jgi:hypothetical protein
MARDPLPDGVAGNSPALPHPALVEFASVVAKPRAGGRAVLSWEEAWWQGEDLLTEFPVLYPNEKLFRAALLGMAAYKFPWYDAYIRPYAEHH